METTHDPGTDELTLETVQLVRNAQNGDMTALDRLVQRYYERIRCIVRLRMGTRARAYADSDEILQETFVAAVGAFDRFEMRNEGAFVHWLGQLAENKIRELLDYHHAQKRDRRREQALQHVSRTLSSGDFVLDPPARGPLPVEVVGQSEEIELLLDCAHALPEDYRRAIELRHFVYEDGDWARIADAMGKSTPAAARMTYSRAVTALLRSIRKVREGRRPS